MARYTEAIAVCDQIPGFYGNRAAALARLNRHAEAIQDCDSAVAIDPTYSKGYGRKGMSLKALGRLDEARAAYVKASELDPDCAQFKEALAELPPPSGLAGLLQGSAARGVAESLLGSTQAAGLIAGLQGMSSGEGGEGPTAAGVLNTLSSQVRGGVESTSSCHFLTSFQ